MAESYSADGLDYISLLPDCLIHHIFSFLPTRDVVKTCMLSNRWRTLWNTVPNLSFSVPRDDRNLTLYQRRGIKRRRHSSFVDRVLLSYASPKVKKFDIEVLHIYDHASILDLWLGFAVDRGVEELSVVVEGSNGYRIPPFLYDCSSFKDLCLKNCHFMDIRSIGWSHLKSLSLYSSGLCDEVASRILMGTPVLEYLKLEQCWGLTNIEVHSRSLRELVIHGYVDYSEMDFPLRISVPHLLLLRIKGYLGVKRIKIIKALSLVEAELDFKMVFDQGGLCGEYGETFVEMLRSIRNATKIIVAAQCLQNCKSLILDICVTELECPAIAYMLASSPHLEKLVILLKTLRCGFILCKPDLVSRNVHEEDYQVLQMMNLKGLAKRLKHLKVDWLLALMKFLVGDAPSLKVLNAANDGLHESNYAEAVNSFKLPELAQQIPHHERAFTITEIILYHQRRVS